MREKILLVDDEESILLSLKTLFLEEGYEVYTSASAQEALDLLFGKAKQRVVPDLILLDVCLPDLNGLQLFEEIKQKSKDLKVIFITAYGNVSQAVEAMRRGAVDYLLKPFSIDEVSMRVSKALEKKNLEKRLDFFKERTHCDLEAKYVQGPNPIMKKIYEDLEVLAKSNSTTLFIFGETGTGKEIIAQRLHELSERREYPFVEVNAAALTADLLESELFGHEVGSFTGATKTKKGLFEVADRGSLFLDEIGDMDLAMQAKILRVLQERKIRRVGGTDFIDVDIRLITATNCDLEKGVEKGEFREDLFYRLNVVPIRLPALRDRVDDIESFVWHFIKVFNKEFGRQIIEVTPEALEALQNYSWPGNVRELRNVIERTVLLECKENTLRLEHLGFLVGKRERISETSEGFGVLPQSVANKIGKNIPLEIIERNHIEGVLLANRGNKNQAAQILGIDRTTLYNKLKKYAIQVRKNL